MNEVFVDSYNSPVFTEIRENPPPSGWHANGVTEGSVLAELKDRHLIAIPSRKSLLRTPELTEKRTILMKMVYRGQISFDMSIAKPNDETSETCLIFYNTKPDLS